MSTTPPDGDGPDPQWPSDPPDGPPPPPSGPPPEWPPSTPPSGPLPGDAPPAPGSGTAPAGAGAPGGPPPPTWQAPGSGTPTPPAFEQDSRSGCGRGIVIGLIVVGVIVLLLGLGAAWLLSRADDLVRDTIPDVIESDEAGAIAPPGTDPTLDALWRSCDDGDMQACDDLFFDSEIGSTYEDFGASCGYRIETGELCVDELGAFVTD